MESLTQKNPLLAEAGTLLHDTNHYTKKDYRAICSKVTAFENHCKTHGYSAPEINDACFFICAFLDEQVSFEKSLLATFYEKGAHQDNEFFDRLLHRQTDSEKNIDLLELAYLCLSLGFRGKYYKSPPGNGIIEIIDTLYTKIRDVRDDIPSPLAIGTIKKEEQYWRCPPIWVTILVALIILISIFIPYNKTLNQYAAPAQDTLQNITQTDNGADEN